MAATRGPQQVTIVTTQTMIAVPCPGVHGSAQTNYRFVLVSGGTARPAERHPAANEVRATGGGHRREGCCELDGNTGTDAFPPVTYGAGPTVEPGRTARAFGDLNLAIKPEAVTLIPTGKVSGA
jgi:hypothetical protein